MKHTCVMVIYVILCFVIGYGIYANFIQKSRTNLALTQLLSVLLTHQFPILKYTYCYVDH